MITVGSEGALTDAQIDVLNRTFSGAGFTFRLAGTTRTDNPAWFCAGSTGSDANAMKDRCTRAGRTR